ncbi:MAG: cytochrome b [Alphaproteobacteria bacterium CG11_big_fil_rev_8_21_14_0_20_44_7]|nr:MAG: cytochrome b [Alphaproteobacteria bacterium CG11_big_fil_rev_8_21_14_0_20_44_7]
MATEKKEQEKGIIGWIDYRLPIISMMKHSTVDYLTPKNLNYLWNFGSLAGICLVIQIITGILLAMHYTPHVDHAFASVEHIMRDVNYGWLLRYTHAVGASMFFIVVYIHVFRGLYYGSYKSPREILWWIGVIIMLAMMATAFMGYVLPWGQMSFWGATVITNFFDTIPLIGEDIAVWLKGGFSIDNPTLNRFFALHYLLPFVIFGLVFLHLMALHTHGSNNPTGVEIKTKKDTIPFHPYYTIKDVFGFGVFFLIFSYFIFFAPNYLGHPDNYIEADPLVTPSHIVPEWYFLPFYAILRAIPNAFLGVVAMFASIAILLFIPWLDRSKVRSTKYRPVYKSFFWLFVFDCLFLGWIGGMPAEGWYIWAGRFATLYYFFHFLVIMPMVGKLEKTSPLPDSISEAK